MAVTYELELESTEGLVSYRSISTSDLSLTGLVGSTAYDVRVRSIDTLSGVEHPSAWVETSFTTPAAPVSVVVSMGSVSSPSTLNGLTFSIVTPPVIVDSYEVLVQEIGGASSVVSGISGSSYQVTGLTGETDYTVSVRSVRSVDGVRHPSAWITSSTFTTTAAATNVTVSLGSVTSPSTMYSLTPVDSVPQTTVSTYEIYLEEVGVGSSVITGISGSTYQLTSLTSSADYLLRVRRVDAVNGVRHPSAWTAESSFTATAGSSAVTVVLGSINTPSTLNQLTFSLVAPSTPIAPDHWTISIYRVSDDALIWSSLVNGSQAAVTGLQVFTEYRAEVVGYALGGKSTTLSGTFLTTGQSITITVPTVSSPEQALDLFYIDSTSYFYDTVTGRLTISGTTNEDLDQISSDPIDGNTLIGIVDGNEFTLSTINGTLSTYMMEELEGEFDIEINSSGDLLEIA